MNSFRTIHYNDLLEVVKPDPTCNAESDDGFTGLTYDNRLWGQMHQRTLVKPEFRISHFQAELNDNFAVSIEDQELENSVNICFNLSGNMGVSFKNCPLETSLAARKQHCLYVRDTAYSILIKKAMHNVHFAIDRDYYLSLLQDNDDWKGMRKKLEHRETTYEGEFDVTPAMTRVINEILYNPFTGGLRAIMQEAKVIELVALQLNSSSAGKRRENWALKKSIDLFISVRDHLDQTFMQDHSLKTLGKTFGINECKLKSGFKGSFGKTIFEYIHNLRMDHAYHLLHDDGLQVNEVSGKVGYKNPNHFSTAFKKKFGINPGKI